MRLHRLTLEAIGPFAERQDIDFETLTASGLFLFEGPTGSGKSSILDAITFALYGNLASETSDGGRLHSDFAAEMTPHISLEFSVGDQRFRIDRTPKHVRKKKRGEGMMQESEKASLYRIRDGQSRHMSSNISEISTLIIEEIGLNREQFTRVVLLPQGEFARFLRASDDERQEVLTRLFGAERFTEISDDIKRRAKEARESISDAKRAAEDSLNLLTDLANAHAPDSDDPWTVDQEDLRELMVAEEQHLRSEVEALQTASHQAQQQLNRARDNHARAQQWRRTVTDYLSLHHQHIEHRRARHAHEARREQLDRAERAMPLQRVIRKLQTAEHDALTSDNHLQQLCQSHDVAAVDLNVEEMRQQSEALRSLYDQLQHAADVERRLPSLRQLLLSEEDKLATARHQRQQVSEEKEALTPILDSRRTRVLELTTVAATLDDKQQAFDRAAALREVMGELQPATDAYQQTAREAQQASAKYRQAVETYDNLVQRRFENMAGELATQLIDGQPCLVCGSLNHPQPAAVGEDPVTAEMCEAANDVVVRLAEINEQAQRAHNQAQTHLTSIQTQLQDLDASAIDKHYAAATAAVQQAKDAQRELESLSEQVRVDQEKEDELTTRENTLNGDIRALEATILEQQRAITEHEQTVETARNTANSVQERRRDLQSKFSALEEILTALTDRNAAALRATDARSEATDAIAEANFSSLDAALQALLTPEELQSLRENVNRWAEEDTRLQNQLASEQFGAVREAIAQVQAEYETNAEPGTVLYDRAQATEQECQDQWQRAELEASQASQAETLGKDRLASFETKRHDVERTGRTYLSTKTRLTPIVRLDEVIRATRGTAMSLTGFVLRFWFGQVLQAANQRLTNIAGGRYQLELQTEKRTRQTRYALGFTVVDNFTGRSRSPQTLSGGETFYVSLALALGLADIVQAEAGGASLHTLFIDEGFGTLDPVTLEDVLGIIDGLRDNGRVIGIVSHVGDLKERIPEQLQIRRDADNRGPSAVFVQA